MDSPQSVNNKRSADENLLQNQYDDNMSCIAEEGEEGIETKHSGEELNPFKIGNILEKVLSFLDADSIKNARQINTLLSVEGAKMLMTKCYVKIPSDLQVEDLSTKSKAMDEFVAFLAYKSREMMMIPNITIDKIDDFELWRSLGVLGPQVKSLKVDNFIDESILLSLLDLLPNLKYLKIEKMGVYLFTIRILTSVMSKAEKQGKPLVISFVDIHPQDMEQLDEIEKFADCKNMMVEKLKVEPGRGVFTGDPNVKVKIVNIMSKILSTSQNIIKKLTLDSCELYLPLLKFPCMTALTHLTLDFGGSTFSTCKFSPSFRFSENIPNLQDISINHKFSYYIASIDRDFFKDLLETCGIASSVNRITIWGGYSDLAADPIFNAFPNIQDLEMIVDWRSEKLFQSLCFLGEKVRKLTFHLDRKITGNHTDLDPILTGFTPEIVDKIRKTPNLDPLTWKEFEECRVNPSILNLKDLEQLMIYLRGDATGWPEGMLAGATRYTFNSLPNNPRIFIRVDDCGVGLECAKKTLEQVSNLPNVVCYFEEYAGELRYALMASKMDSDSDSDIDGDFDSDVDSDSD